MNLDELIAAIAGFTEPATLIEGLKKKAKPFYQTIFDEGHRSATGTNKEEKLALEKRAKDAETEATKAKADLETAKSTSDVAKLHEQYAKEIKELKDAHVIELATLKDGIQAERSDLQVEKLEARLIALGVDKDKAEVLAGKDDVKSRIKPGRGKKLQVLQPGKDIPYSDEGDAALDRLAEELAGGLDSKWITSAVSRGSGSAGGAQGAGGATGQQKGKQLFQAIREKAEAELKKSNSGPADPQAELNARTGQRR